MAGSSRVSAILYEQSDLRGQPPIELREPVRPKALDFPQDRRRIVQQRLNVDALAVRCKRREVAWTAREHVDRAVVIQPPQMVEGDADLQDALVEVADVATFR